MKKYNVIGIGEILWDMLPDGKILGGAPANFAYHVCQLGAVGSVISAVSKDPLGNEILEILQEIGVDKCLSFSDKPTGTVSVDLADGMPTYTIHQEVAWDYIDLTEEARNVLREADAICFGSLAQRNQKSRDSIWEALDLVPDRCVKVFDINLRQHFFSKETIEKSLQVADIFKLNDDELILVAEMFALKGSEETLCKQLMDKFNLKVLTLTKGSIGSVLMTTGERSELPTPQVTVADTVGAGDSFTATITLGLLHGVSLRIIHELAIEVSAFVCTQKGATPLLPVKLTKKIESILGC